MRPYTIVLPLLFTFIALAPAPAARGHGHEDREPREVRESHEQRDLDRDIRDAERRQLDAAREQEKARLDAERDSAPTTSQDSSTSSDSGGSGTSNSGSSSDTSGSSGASNSGSSTSGSNSGTSNSGSSSSTSGSNSGTSNSGSSSGTSGSNSGTSNSGSSSGTSNSGSSSGTSGSSGTSNSGSSSGTSGSSSGSSGSGSGDDDSEDDSDDDSDSGSDDDEVAAAGGGRIDVETDSEGRERRRDELLVRGGRELGETLRTAGFQVLSLRHLSNLDQSVARVRVRDGSSIDADRLFVRRVGGVADAEPNYVFRLSGTPTAKTTDAAATTGARPANTAPPNAIRVGVVDTGADPAAPGLGDGLLVSRAFGGGYTARAHGTHVAQILIREGVRVELADVFQTDVRGAPVATAESIARGIDWLASRRLPVINVSITGPRSALLSDVVARAIARGTILVAAAGNDGPAAPPTYPAAFPEVVGVTAVDADGRVYRRANRGEYVDFAAFGVRVPVSGDGGRVEYISGTSYAAPLVAAAIARGYRQTRPEATTDEVAALRGRVVDLGDRGRDPVFGWGALSLPAKSHAPH